ncbi:MAG: DUF4271 domain-containing protein [Bacteroides sp.]|nr:DUF4271 domain-containing protein [Bacteroidales bacterium]MBD5317442.1 DUF4271 domain-containing protein [Bacteroides sp.]
MPDSLHTIPTTHAHTHAAPKPAARTATPDTLGLPWTPLTVSEVNCPVALRGECGTGSDIPPYRHGMAPEERPQLPGYDSGTMVLLLGVFVLIAANFRHYSTFLKTFANDLWSVRRRGNVFDDHTVSETRIMGSLLLLACVCEGILAFGAVSAGLPAGSSMSIFPAIMTAVGVAVGYYVWQLAAYSITGYTFAAKSVRRQWLKGFNASQALLGLGLVIPAVMALFNPALSVTLAIIGAALYATARIIFICKGFRLFYDNFGSLLYFILYLCTLEITPVVILYKARSLFYSATV